MNNPSDVFLRQYKEAAGAGGLLELKLRMLADKVPSLAEHAHAQRLEAVEESVLDVFGETVSEADRTVLKRCRQLRNKLLHCDFYAARSRLHALGAPARSGGVRKIDIAGLSGLDLIQRLQEVASRETTHVQAVSEMTSTAEAGVYGWLLELGEAGDFLEATVAFQRAIEVVDRLSSQLDEREMKGP